MESVVEPTTAWTPQTGKRTSLGTTNADDARQIIEAKNNSERQPVLNLQIAKAYLAGSDNGITTRTWQHAIEALTNTKQGANQHRWKTAAKDKAFVTLLPQVIIETEGETLLKVLQMGTVSTNVYLRRLHNFCVDMNWLPWPLVPKRQWPAVEFKEKRGITLAEHLAIVTEQIPNARRSSTGLALITRSNWLAWIRRTLIKYILQQIRSARYVS